MSEAVPPIPDRPDDTMRLVLGASLVGQRDIDEYLTVADVPQPYTRERVQLTVERLGQAVVGMLVDAGVMEAGQEGRDDRPATERRDGDQAADLRKPEDESGVTVTETVPTPDHSPNGPFHTFLREFAQALLHDVQRSFEANGMFAYQLDTQRDFEHQIDVLLLARFMGEAKGTE